MRRRPASVFPAAIVNRPEGVTGDASEPDVRDDDDSIRDDPEVGSYA